jgi:cytochrome c553
MWDAQTGRLYVRSKDVPRNNRVVSSDGTDKYIDHAYSGHLPFDNPSSALGAIPLIKPPYAHLTAIDLNKAEILWQVPVGEGSRAIRNHPLLAGVKLPERLGSPANGGGIVTAGGLIFIGGGDGYLYAFDKTNGRELWRGELPYVNGENVMTYRSPAGRQFVLVSTGASTDASLVAFAVDAAGRQGPPTSTAAVRQSGAAHFARVCQSCHGAAGRGDAAPRLVPFSRADDDVLGLVRDGRGQMPPISARELSDEAVLQVVAYLKSLTP